MPTRDDRIELRTTKEEECLLASAAACERFVVSERDSERVPKLLENPPRPTISLLAAAHRRVGKYPVRSSGARSRLAGITIARASTAAPASSTSTSSGTRERTTNPAAPKVW